MPITSTNSFSLATIQEIDIDCSAVRNDAVLAEEFGSLIGLVKSSPKRSAVHVKLRFATASVTGRKLKSIFQSLGCTVTMKTAF
jgi:hypothetical protein